MRKAKRIIKARLRVTNKHKLPDPFVAAVRNDSYEAGDCDFTVTEIVGPARMHALLQKHGDKLSEDASDRTFALMGQAVHYILEQSGTGLKEERLFGQIGTHTVSGKFDHISLTGGTMTDWKLTSVYAAKKGKPVKPEWVAQLNGLRLLAHLNGYKKITHLQVGAIYRDWRPYESRHQRNYPLQVEAHPVPVWSFKETEKFFLDRIREHLKARKKLTPCSNEETWNGRRCERYCAAAPVCAQFLGPIRPNVFSIKPRRS